MPEQEIERTDEGFELRFRPQLPVEDWNAQISLMTGMAAAELARCLFPPAREPVRRTSFDLPASTHARLRWAKHTTGKPMGQLIAEVVDAAYPEPIPTARSRTS